MSEPNRIVVVGSGPAGAAAAVFASRVPGVETLVLEAGSARRPLGFTVRVKGLTVAKRRPPLGNRRDLVLAGDPKTVIYEELAPGGLSNHWSCAVPRFSSQDFEDAARAGEEFAWPVGYGDLEPWYERIEPLLCVSGGTASAPQLPAGRITTPRHLGADWERVADAARSDARAVVPMPYAYGGSTFFTPAGTSFNAYTRLVAPAVARGTIAFRDDTRVTRLEWSAREGRVVAVWAVDAQGRESRIACRAVVIAAGAVNSAKLLLASANADFPEGLGNARGVVGRYLHDHPLGKIVIELARPISVQRAAYITRPTLDRSAPLLAAAYMQWTGTGTLARSLLSGRPGLSNEIGFTVFGAMVPRADDYVALEPGNGGASPSLRVALRHPPEVATLLEQARREVIGLFERAGYGPREKVWVIEAPGTSVHYGGTCRMHASPRYGVVDAWSRVHDVPNVAVADSAVFTTTPEKNPVLTAMTLAARAADRLAREIAEG